MSEIAELLLHFRLCHRATDRIDGMFWPSVRSKWYRATVSGCHFDVIVGLVGWIQVHDERGRCSEGPKGVDGVFDRAAEGGVCG